MPQFRSWHGDWNTAGAGGVLEGMFPLLHPALVRATAVRSRWIRTPRGLSTHWDKR